MEVWDLRTAEGRYLFGYSIGRAGKKLTYVSLSPSTLEPNDPDLQAGWDDGSVDFELWLEHGE